MSEKYTIPEEILRKLYLDEKLSMNECAAHFGCSSSLIELKLGAYDIPTRPPGSEPVEIAEEELYELYVEAGLSTVDIAEKFDCHNSTISDRLAEYGIKARGPNHGRSLQIPEDELRRLYVEEERTTYELGEYYNCDPTVIERRLRWYGIEERHTLPGDNDWEEPYGDNWDEQRRRAKERSDYKCEHCGISEDEHRRQFVDETRNVGIGLDVHHKIRAGLFRRWNVPDIEDANALRNLQVLCQECHAEHGDRGGTY